MAYREVTMVEIKEVLRLWLTGTPKKAIAARLGCDPKTVRRYIRAAEAQGASREVGPAWLTDEHLAAVVTALKAPPARERGASWQRCEQQRSFIEAKLSQGLKLTKIHRLLRRRGVEVAYRSLHRFAVDALGYGARAATIPVLEGSPGQQLQVDVGWMGQLEPDQHGRRRWFRAWIFTAAYSRQPFVYPVWRETTETAIAACEAAWRFFGGVFEVLCPDNTAAIIAGADPVSPRINPTFLEYAQHRGFHVDPTRVRSPQDKALVERMVRHAREDCFAGERLHDLDEARRRGAHWCRHEYGMRPHSRTRRRPLELFEHDEQPALAPPPSSPYDRPVWAEPKVARDQHVQVAKALYSLPREHQGRSLIGRRIRARADRHTVRLYDRGELIKTHARQPPGARATDANDFPTDKVATAQRDLAFIQRQAHQHGPSIGAYAQALLDVALPWTRVRRVYALLGLARRYGDARVDAACEQALAIDMVDVKRLQRLIEQAQPPAGQAPNDARATPAPAPARFLRDARAFAPSPRRQPGGADHHDPVQQQGDS